MAARDSSHEECDRSRLLDFYRGMILARKAEERMEVLHRQGHVTGGFYRCLGQEAIGVGTAFALDRRTDGSGDVIGHSVRNIGAIFLFGGTPEQYFRQYLARATGPTRGKDANVHWSDFEKGLVGPISPLGTMVGVLAGITLSFRLRGQDRVGLVYCGDGATSTGAWHEGMTVASAFRCPLISIVEANGYAFSTPTSRQTRAESFVQKAPGFGIEGESVDGNDVLAVYEATRRAAERAREGEGPVLLEFRTYRRRGHAQHDDQAYVAPEEVEAWEERDPVDRFRDDLLGRGWTTEELGRVDASVDERVHQAAETALEEPMPRKEWAVSDVYADGDVRDAAVPWTRRPEANPRRSASAAASAPSRETKPAGAPAPSTSSAPTSTGSPGTAPTSGTPGTPANSATPTTPTSERPEHVSGTTRGVPVTYLEAISEGIWEEMERDPDVFLLGEDIAVYGGAFKLTRGFLERFGEARVIDAPIAEAGFTAAAAGAAHWGMRPVIEMQFMDFVGPAYDVITNYVATSSYRGGGALPLVIRGPVGGGNRGGPFHSQNVEMAFFHTPGLKIVYPSTPYDAKGLIKAAIRDDDPVIFEEHKGLYRDPDLRETLPDEDYVVPLGRARAVRDGRDLTIVTYGATTHQSVAVAERLARDDGIEVEVLDLRTLLPLDEDAVVESVKKTGKLLVVHEDTRTGGIAGEIAAIVNERAFEWLDGPILRVTALDAPVPYAGTLEDYFLPGVDDTVTAARYLAAY